MAAKTVHTTSNGRPYVLKDGRACFITLAAARKAGWTKPAPKRKSAPRGKSAAKKTAKR
jgi:hypothetical protein